jgi:predicted O-methyltransferase YrrM
MLRTRRKTLRQVAGLLETTNFLMLKLLWKRPDRARVFPGLMFRDYMSLVERAAWRAATLFDVFPELRERPARIQLAHLPGEGVETRLDELGYLALAAAAVKPKMIFEFGTFRGRTALNFALNSPPECRVFTLDLPRDDRTGASERSGAADASIIAGSETGIDYQGAPEAAKIVQLYGDSTTFDFRPFFGQVDLVFVDGGHSYDVALSDTRNALAMVRAGGVVLWHDFANYGDYHDVIRAVLAEVPGDELFQIEDSQLAVYRKPD